MNVWPKVRLDECSRIVAGATPSTSVTEYWNGDICWATPKDLSDLESHYLDETPRKITRSGLENCAAEILPINSVLFSSRAPIGHVAINRVPTATNQGFKSFVPDTSKLLPTFLFHWLRANRSLLENLGNGATFKEVSKATVSRIEIELPPLPDQQRIAAILDQADALRAKRRQSLAKLDTLTQSLFLNLFGDPTTNSKNLPTVALNELVRKGDNINYGVVQPGDESPNGVPLVRVGNFLAGEIDLGQLKRISPEIEAAYERSRLKGDEILISCVGSIGNVAICRPEMKGMNIARAVARVPVDPQKADHIFLSEYLRMEFVQRYFRSETRTVSQPTLNIKQILEVPVRLPPLSMQHDFATRAVAFGRARAAQITSKSRLDTLFASLQHRAFRGEL